ncbi:hypothetical protein BX616_009344 [Lobosporangium transversale]|uniref:Uncharacterized protein n=1 Tax=Lobosporangium transversale TaxID=64571 RepID=A0A1Y2GIV6_9FUNG|nr:hypothetical protein BCR41DRAFT_423310 [Lobosporangium transversale]KAF9918329.1 hypothetical protein BX616_009344 [Lobosporangium transversale]ORZ12122.1 hypothetical protein BCR41DRAFT_423310 [Lobosporangium transversale]|eukprot:XP_021879987.1 hypothetical protein BCR41DRAFT_423310 [Lobosporangium transversale]
MGKEHEHSSFQKDNASLTASVSYPSKKRRLTRSPTPHALADCPSITVLDNSDNIDANSSSNRGISDNNNNNQITSCKSPASSSSLTSTIAESIKTSSNMSQSAGLSLFDSLAGLTPEAVELARATRENTKANSLIGRPEFWSSPFRRSDSKSVRNASPLTQSNSSGPHLKLSAYSIMRHSSAITNDSPRTPPNNVLYMDSDDMLDDQDETLADPSVADSPTSLPLSSEPSDTSLLSSQEFDADIEFHTKKRRISGQDNTSPHSLPYTQPSVSPPQTQFQQQSPKPSFSENKESPVTSPLKKTVRFDDSKNSIFGYEHGSTIISSKENNALEYCSDSDYTEDERDEDLEVDQYNPQHHMHHGKACVGPDDQYPNPPPWWSWSSLLIVPGLSSQPTQANIDASSHSAQGTRRTAGSNTSPSTSTATNENALNLSQTSQSDNFNSNHNTFLNIASSLDRLWSSAQARTAHTPALTAPSCSEPLGSLASSPSPEPLFDQTIFSTTNPPKVPLLKHQLSAPAVGSASTSAAATIESPKSIVKPPLLWRQGSQITLLDDMNEQDAEREITDIVGSTALSKRLDSSFLDYQTNECDDTDIVMGEVLPMDSLEQQVSQVRPKSPQKRAFSRERARSHGGMGRAPQKSESGSIEPFVPPRMVRAASFSIQCQTVRPILRREASTTALLDSLT